MYYVYLLKSKCNGKFYLGSTDDLKQRFYTHNHGDNLATKAGIPWRLVYYEAYPTRADAKNRETKLKHHGKGIAEIKKRLTLVEP